MAGKGNGFVDAFDLEGHMIDRVGSGGTLDSPWGLAIAPQSFGKFAGDLLVGNFATARSMRSIRTTWAPGSWRPAQTEAHPRAEEYPVGQFQRKAVHSVSGASRRQVKKVLRAAEQERAWLAPAGDGACVAAASPDGSVDSTQRIVGATGIGLVDKPDPATASRL